MFNSGMFSADKLNSLKGGLTRLFHLYLEKTKLTVAERLSLLLAAGVMIFICSLLAIIGMVFASGALIELLSLWISPIASWAIVGGVYLLLAALIVLLRKPLIFNPVSRFVSMLIFKEDAGPDPADGPVEIPEGYETE